jgi:hypothetical protein
LFVVFSSILGCLWISGVLQLVSESGLYSLGKMMIN